MSKKTKTISEEMETKSADLIALNDEESLGQLYEFLKAKFKPVLNVVDKAIFIGTCAEFIEAETIQRGLDADAKEQGFESHQNKIQSERDEEIQAITFDFKGEKRNAGYADEADKKKKDAYSHTQGFTSDIEFQKAQLQKKIDEERAKL